jgi:hypothetical protein
MKRTILVLTLTLALSSALPVRASNANANLGDPTGNRPANSGISLYYAILELFTLGS